MRVRVRSYGLAAEEYAGVRQEYDEHMVSGLNKAQFRSAITRLISAYNQSAQTTGGGGKVALPKERDLLKAFELADQDKSGVVDLGEFASLYARVKRGEVKGLGGHGFLGLF